MALTLVSTTASERLLRHVQSLSETEAEDVLRLLVRRREQVISKILDHGPSAPIGMTATPSSRR